MTKALESDLYNRWGIEATVLYDRPADIFRPISLDEKHQLFLKLSNEISQFGDGTISAFTEVNENGDVLEKPGRPLLLVSSTSWTEDEDFSVLLDALRIYDKFAQKLDQKVICAITGKGPLKEHYRELMSQETLSHVEFVLPWLEPEDYPKLLAAADLGVCLHTSSSLLDLPMKVVDMFGCALPVCAISYNW